MSETEENIILHVLVVGFHHKKGCQVEYAFPPLIEGTSSESNECPSEWKYLPTLALPDGSHNYEEDTVYFHLPSLTDSKKTVFGISCFRQIPVEKLKNQTADLTRNTVQKSVCVLSTVPLYGHVQVKMALITHAYFEEGDFSKVSLLKDTYHHLNSCLSQIEDLSNAPQLFVGLSARELILKFRHNALLLFKLLLLERKCVFYCSPVKPLCSTILSLLSLHPSMIETGLAKSTSINIGEDNKDFSQEYQPKSESSLEFKNGDASAKYSIVDSAEEVTLSLPHQSSAESTHPQLSEQGDQDTGSDRFTIKETPTEEGSPSLADDGRSSTGGSALSRDVSMDTLAHVVSNLEANVSTVAAMDPALCGLPLNVFDSVKLKKTSAPPGIEPGLPACKASVIPTRPRSLLCSYTLLFCSKHFSTMQNTEGGRKLNQAMMNTSKAVATTSKAVGGAIAQAKGAVTTWWSSLTAIQTNGGFESNIQESDETEEP
ncbi:late secretory pathway protein AVL9 homolog, partial [Diaphorina citri]|uniref:Late secretory pathway protein AVL9 homolog n=1 Tax=Diaphorina citri TaxID=121845 RepID=A0A3Q0IYF3_DIACI